MKGMYLFCDSRSGCYGEPVIFHSDRHARAASFDILTSGDVPKSIVSDFLLYKIADYDDSDGLPVIKAFDNPVVVMRGSDQFVQDALDKIAEPSEKASE